MSSFLKSMSKCRANLPTRPTFTLDTSSLMNLHKEKNNLVIYTVLTFVIVLLLYLGTKDWKGVTAPEEVDLGYMRVPQPIPHHRRKPYHHPQRYRYHRECDEN
ncbi:hypothetical protein O0L34_g12406 [Tuta absoluta]|nr:hypothetical protein O0L34_g12406 [Tuta absoluta]